MFFRKKNTVDASKSPEELFWDWFQISDLLETQGQDLLEQVMPRLNKIHEVLVAEVGPIGQHPREFILSSDGILEGVQYVERLADSAPKLTEWKITRFRPPLTDYQRLGIKFGENHRNPEGLMYTLKKDASLFDIAIFAQWCDESGPPDGVIFILLDMAIGEYNVMCRIGDISVHPLQEAPEHASSWDQLQAIFL